MQHFLRSRVLYWLCCVIEIYVKSRLCVKYFDLVQILPKSLLRSNIPTKTDPRTPRNVRPQNRCVLKALYTRSRHYVTSLRVSPSCCVQSRAEADRKVGPALPERHVVTLHRSKTVPPPPPPKHRRPIMGVWPSFNSFAILFWLKYTLDVRNLNVVINIHVRGQEKVTIFCNGVLNCFRPCS